MNRFFGTRVVKGESEDSAPRNGTTAIPACISSLRTAATFGVACLLLAQTLQAQFAYVSNGGGSNNVSAYRVGENGALAPVPGSPFAVGNLPSSVAVDPTGRFAYVVNEAGNNISAFAIDKNGDPRPYRFAISNGD